MYTFDHAALTRVSFHRGLPIPDRSLTIYLSILKYLLGNFYFIRDHPPFRELSLLQHHLRYFYTASQVTYSKPGRLSAGMTCAVDISFRPKVKASVVVLAYFKDERNISWYISSKATLSRQLCMPKHHAPETKSRHATSNETTFHISPRCVLVAKV